MTKSRKAAVGQPPAKKLTSAEKMNNHLPAGVSVAPSPDGKVQLTLDQTKSPDCFRAIGGAKNALSNMLIVDEVLHVLPDAGDVTTAGMRAGGALHMVETFAPKDAVEAMIASQAVALHLMTMETARRAMLPKQPADIASKLRKDAANAARAMVDMCEALERRRGKAPQVVRVERVVVNEGGQAVVGHVQAGGVLPTAAAPLVLEHGAPPEPIMDAIPVTVERGRG